MVTAEWLKKAELFARLEEPQLSTLFSHSALEPCPEGKTVFRQGEEATRLYILVEGLIELTVKTEEKIALMTSKVEKEGEAFGIPSLIEPFLYNVTATCIKPSTVLRLDSKRIMERMEEDPRMGMEIMKRLASLYFNRLNDIRRGVSNLVKVLKLRTP